MDLISREAVINIATSSCLDLDSYDDTEEFCDEVKEISSAFEGMTYKDVVKAVFPDAVVIVNDLNRTVRVVFSDEVWNSSYKGVSK